VSGALLLQFLAAKFYREERWIQLEILFAFTWFTFILFSVFALLVQVPYGFQLQTVSKTLAISAVTAALGFVLFPLLERWLKPRLKTRQYELF
jgi:membrane protein insertase Oxa1/YidC/SpoIIIJ